MLNLRVSTDGLTAFAQTCAQRAVVLRSALATCSSGPPFQASAHGVTTSDSLVGAASNAMADRVDDLSSKLTSAAAQYLGRDQESGDELNQTIAGSPL
jgi:hypothetical protein